MNTPRFRLTLTALLLALLMSLSAASLLLPASGGDGGGEDVCAESEVAALPVDGSPSGGPANTQGLKALPSEDGGREGVYPAIEQQMMRPRIVFPGGGSRGDGGARADYDIGLDVSSTYYVSSGIPEWGYASLGIVGRPVEIHTSINNYGTQPVGDINLTCTIYLWLDIGPLNGGPIVFRQSQMVYVSGGYGSNSGDIPFMWTPAKAQCYLINVSARYSLDPNAANNEGWFYGTAYPQPMIRFITGLYTDSWANNGTEATDFTGDLGPANAWHLVQDVPIDTVEKPYDNAAWYFGNDTTGNCTNVTGPVALITPSISLADYDPFAKDPEEPASANSAPQIYFDYKWAGDISLASGGGMYTYISTDNGQSWDAIVTDDFGYERAVNGSTYNTTYGKYRWKFWVHDTKNQYTRYGIPIGDYVGKTVKFKLEYRPGSGNRSGMTGMYVDDLIVWGRQRYDYRGFTVEPLSALERSVNASESADFAMRVSTIEDLTQSVRVSLKDGPAGWKESAEVVISDPLFYLGPKPAYKDVTVTVRPPEAALAGRHTLNLTFIGDVQRTIQINVTILPNLGLGMSCPRVSSVNKSGESAVFEVSVANLGNLPERLWLNVTNATNGWAGIYASPQDIDPIDNLTLGNRQEARIFLRVDIPLEVWPGEYIYRLEATSKDRPLSAVLDLSVLVMQYFDLKLTIANPHQQMTPDNSEDSRTIEFQFLVANQGNGQDNFLINTTPIRPEDAQLTPVLDMGNSTLEPGEVRDVTWTLVAPINMSAGYHNFSIMLRTNSTEIDYSDNAGLVSILVRPPEVVDVYNLTFEGPLRTNPEHPARGQSVEILAPVRNTGNLPVILKVWSNASGVLSPASMLGALEPNATANVSATVQFLSSGSFGVTLLVEMYSNLTKPNKGRVQISGVVEVGDIDLRVDKFSLLRNKVALDPKKDPLHNNDTITISMNISNMGTVNASGVKVTVYLIAGNGTTVVSVKEAALLEAGSNRTLADVFTVDSSAERLTLKVQVTGQGDYVDINMSNNVMSQEYSVAQADNPPKITMWALLIIIVSVIIFLTLILVVYIVTIGREGRERPSRGPSESPAYPEGPDDLKIDFIDYEDVSRAPGQGQPSAPPATRPAANRPSKPKLKPSASFQRRSIKKKKKGPKKK